MQTNDRALSYAVMSDVNSIMTQLINNIEAKKNSPILMPGETRAEIVKEAKKDQRTYLRAVG